MTKRPKLSPINQSLTTIRLTGISRLAALLLACLLLLTLTACGQGKTSASGTEEYSLWRINDFNAANVLTDNGADCCILRQGDTLTRMNLDGTVSKSCSFTKTNDVLSCTFDDGQKTDLTVKELDFGYQLTAPDGSYGVLFPYFDDVYYHTMTTADGNTTRDVDYVVMEDGVMSYYNYDGSQQRESASYAYKDGKFVFNDQAEEITFNNYGFSCQTADGIVYSFSRMLDGFTYYATGYEKCSSSTRNGAVTYFDGNKNKVYYGYLWYHAGVLGCTYPPAAASSCDVVFSDTECILKDKKDGREFINLPILQGHWSLDSYTKADGSVLTAEEVAAATFEFVFNPDGTGVEAVEDLTYQFTYDYDVTTNKLTLNYTGRDTAAQTLTMSADFTTLQWDYSNPDHPDYVGASYTFKRAASTDKGADVPVQIARIGVMTGSVNKTIVKEKYPAATMVEYADYVASAEALSTGEIDYAVMDYATASKLVNSNDKLAELPEKISQDNTAMALNKQNKELNAKICALVDKYLADGTMNDIITRWLQEDGSAYELQPNTAAEDAPVLRVAVSTKTEPRCYIDADGNTTGMLVEIMDKMAAELEMRVEYIDLPFASHMESLQKGECDVVPAMYETEARAEQADFTVPYFYNPQVMLTVK